MSHETKVIEEEYRDFLRTSVKKGRGRIKNITISCLYLKKIYKLFTKK